MFPLHLKISDCINNFMILSCDNFSNFSLGCFWPATKTLTWRQKARIAGIGIMAATTKAELLPKDVRRMATPVRFKHSPVCSWKTTSGLTLDRLPAEKLYQLSHRSMTLLIFFTNKSQKSKISLWGNLTDRVEMCTTMSTRLQPQGETALEKPQRKRNVKAEEHCLSYLAI